MKTIHKFLLAAMLAALAVTALAAVSPAKRSWADGPVQYLMTKEETAAWRALDSDAAADDFIALFWARRDPTPGTPRNELREDFEAKVKFADEQFSAGTRKGSMSDRGKAVLLFGVPLKAVNVQPEMRGKTSDATHDPDQQVRHQIWIYESPVSRKIFHIPHVKISFIHRIGSRDFPIEVGPVVLQPA